MRDSVESDRWVYCCLWWLSQSYSDDRWRLSWVWSVPPTRAGSPSCCSGDPNSVHRSASVDPPPGARLVSIAWRNHWSLRSPGSFNKPFTVVRLNVSINAQHKFPYTVYHCYELYVSKKERLKCLKIRTVVPWTIRTLDDSYHVARLTKINTRIMDVFYQNVPVHKLCCCSVRYPDISPHGRKPTGVGQKPTFYIWTRW